MGSINDKEIPVFDKKKRQQKVKLFCNINMKTLAWPSLIRPLFCAVVFVFPKIANTKCKKEKVKKIENTVFG